MFADPAHVDYGEPIDFTALSLLFATLNCVPLILLVFKQDKTYKNDTNAVFLKMSEAVYDMQEAEGKRVKRADTGVSANKALHALLVLPRYAPALPGSVDATVFYGAVAVFVGARRDRVSAVPATDCQASIFVDLVACAALSVA